MEFKLHDFQLKLACNCLQLANQNFATMFNHLLIAVLVLEIRAQFATEVPSSRLDLQADSLIRRQYFVALELIRS
jgi:hypothetical protein